MPRKKKLRTLDFCQLCKVYEERAYAQLAMLITQANGDETHFIKGLLLATARAFQHTPANLALLHDIIDAAWARAERAN